MPLYALEWVLLTFAGCVCEIVKHNELVCVHEAHPGVACTMVAQAAVIGIHLRRARPVAEPLKVFVLHQPLLDEVCQDCPHWGA